MLKQGQGECKHYNELSKIISTLVECILKHSVAILAPFVECTSLLRSMERRRPDAPSYARMDTFARGMIWGMCIAGCTRDQILDCAVKTDGTQPSVRAVDDVIAKKRDEQKWRGEDKPHSGRPKALSDEQIKKLVDLVFEERGQAKVTVKYCQMKLRFHVK